MRYTLDKETVTIGHRAAAKEYGKEHAAGIDENMIRSGINAVFEREDPDFHSYIDFLPGCTPAVVVKEWYGTYNMEVDCWIRYIDGCRWRIERVFLNLTKWLEDGRVDMYRQKYIED